jgi:hypothetical protein
VRKVFTAFSEDTLELPDALAMMATRSAFVTPSSLRARYDTVNNVTR